MDKFRNQVPLYMMLFSIVLFTHFATVKLYSWSGGMWLVGTLASLCYLIWLISEAKVSITEPEKGQTEKDRGTCELYVFGRFLTVFSALIFSTAWGELNNIMILGLLLLLAAIGFRLWAIATLGRFYSHRVRLVDQHEIIDTGPYGWVRHPAYTGMLLANLGFVMVFFNVYGLLAWALILLPSIIKRIRVEEVALMELSGYPHYAECHKRILPGIW